MNEQDRQQAILSDLIIYCGNITPDTLIFMTVREAINGFFDQQDNLALNEQTFELKGEPDEIYK